MRTFEFQSLDFTQACSRIPRPFEIKRVLARLSKLSKSNPPCPAGRHSDEGPSYETLLTKSNGIFTFSKNDFSHPRPASVDFHPFPRIRVEIAPSRTGFQPVQCHASLHQPVSSREFAASRRRRKSTSPPPSSAFTKFSEYVCDPDARLSPADGKARKARAELRGNK